MSLHRNHPAAAPVDPAGDQIAHLLGAVSNLNDTMAQYVTGQRTRDAARLLGADARYFSGLTWNTTGGAGVVVGTGSGLLLGINVRETQGVPAVVRVFDGTDASGLQLWASYLTGAADKTANFPSGTGIAYTNGLFVQVQGFPTGTAGGTVEGSLYLYAGRVSR